MYFMYRYSASMLELRNGLFHTAQARRAVQAANAAQRPVAECGGAGGHLAPPTSRCTAATKPLLAITAVNLEVARARGRRCRQRLGS
jgi:hypothetical protein